MFRLSSFFLLTTFLFSIPLLTLSGLGCGGGEEDGDGDGWTVSAGDCDDTNPNVYPGADEVQDRKDNDCDGEIDEGTDVRDDDGDGWNENRGDCDDTDEDVYPGADEIPYNGIDEDCDGEDLTDVDGDGYDAEEAGGSDCDDHDPDVNPDAEEIPYNGVDDDCNGFDEEDVDGDGHRAEEVGGDDCNDRDGTIYAGADEIPYDRIDQDCDGQDLKDVDGDGVNSVVVGGFDCDDNDPDVNPGMDEVCGDGKDNDCSGEVDDKDLDNDNHIDEECGGDDCDDDNRGVNPDMTEVEDDDIDNDCDGLIDEIDLTGSISLSETSSSFTGEAEDDIAGWSVAILADMNGDGFDEIAIGAPGNDGSSNNSGKLYLFAGTDDDTLFTPNLSLSGADLTISGEAEEGYFGWRVSGGDFNGDGYGDILVSAPLESALYTYSGAVYLFFGSSTFFSSNTLTTDDADVVYSGEGEYDFAGWSLKGGGDINNDGRDDFIVSADRYDSGLTGEFYLILGRRTGWPSTTTSLGSGASGSFIGESENEDFSDAINNLCMGDVNGDSYDDIVIGEPRYDNYTGKVYVIFGNSSGYGLNSSIEDESYSFVGITDGDYAGFSLACNGDANGDGYEDLIVSSPWRDYSTEDDGVLYLVAGNESSWGRNLSLYSYSSVIIYGVSSNGYIGSGEIDFGDINADGYSDLAFGSPYYSFGALFNGMTTIYYGSLSYLDDSVSLISEEGYELSGTALSISGDINGDGYDDILISAPGSDEADEDAGKVYLFWGNE